MIKTEGCVLGVDVGCSLTAKTSAVCRLEWTERTVTWTIGRFRAVEAERLAVITKIAGSSQASAAAFDGPLRRGLDIIGRYRSAERMLTRRLQPLIGKPGQSSSPVGKALNEHANACAETVLGHCDIAPAKHDIPIHDRAIVEAFPTAFLGLMIEHPAALNARRGDRSDTFYQHLVQTDGLKRLLEYLLPGRTIVASLVDVMNHDDRAALICALTALCVTAERYTAVGDHEDGWIILPPIDLMPTWACDLLRHNAAEERTGSLRHENFALAA